MPRVAKPKPDRLVLLDQALTCLAEQGPQATSIDVLTTTLAISRRTLYEVLGPKADVVQQVYSYAMDLLTADVAPPRPAESLQAYLSRCWQHTAQAALAQPRVFAFWQYYRTSCIVPRSDGVFSGLEFRTHLWDKYSTAAPAQLRRYGALSNTARKAYKA